MAERTTERSKESGAQIRRLVERGQQGDRAALEELYLIHFDRIYSYLHMTVGNRHDAEDLTTQTFLRMLESIGKFRFQSAPFSAWLFRIAHNLSVDHFRASRRVQPEEEVPEPPGSEQRSADEEALHEQGGFRLGVHARDRSSGFGRRRQRLICHGLVLSLGPNPAQVPDEPDTRAGAWKIDLDLDRGRGSTVGRSIRRSCSRCWSLVFGSPCRRHHRQQ